MYIFNIANFRNEQMKNIFDRTKQNSCSKWIFSLFTIFFEKSLKKYLH